MAADRRAQSSRPALTALGKFTAVGVLATGVHGLVALVVARWLTPLAANAAGFAVAVVVTYAGNYRFTFRASGAHGETIVRFTVVSVATLAASEWTLIFLALLGTDQRAALLLAAGAIPLFRFGLMATQVFDHTRWGDGTLRRWVRDWIVVVTAAGAGVAALWATEPAIMDHHGTPAHPTAITDAAERYVAGDWRWPPLSIPMTGEDATVTAGWSRPPIPLFAVPAKVARPLVGADSGYLRAWMLLSFTALGPAVLFLGHALGARSWSVRAIAAAGATATLAAIAQPADLTLQASFLVVLAGGCAVRAGLPGQQRRMVAALAGCVLAALSADPLAGLLAAATVLVMLALSAAKVPGRSGRARGSVLAQP